MRRIAAFLIGLMLAGGGIASAQPQHPSRTSLTFNHYYDFEEMTAALRALVEAYPDLLSMRSLGKSYQGRDLWLVTMNNPGTGKDTDKSAMYIDGNIHGNEVQAAEVVLYTIWYLTKSYGQVEKITQLVDQRAFYFIPMVNPDGRAYWFAAANTSHSSRSGQRPVDSDNDGLFDEDPPNDLNGDGHITTMRKLDPNGNMKVSPEDPRLMDRIGIDDPYDGPRYRWLGSEGIDDDGDGRTDEDGPGGYDMNRNFPSDWQPEHIQFGAGEYPLSEPETRCVADFVMARPNIAAGQAYHNAGGMILRGPASSHLSYPREDERVFDALQARGEKMLPFYRAMITHRDLYTVHGGLKGWLYEGIGAMSFTNELWNEKQRYNRDQGPSSLERLEFDDYVLFGQTYIEWEKHDHPVYGEVEIGGWSKFGARVNPPFMLEETCHRNMAFTLFHADQMPMLAISDVTVEPRGDLIQITVEVRNSRLIPSVVAIAARNRIGRRDSIAITAADGGELTVLAGGTVDDRFDAPLEFVKHKPAKLWVNRGIPGESVRLFRWLVRGTGSATVTYRSDKAGVVTRSFELQIGS